MQRVKRLGEGPDQGEAASKTITGPSRRAVGPVLDLPGVVAAADQLPAQGPGRPLQLQKANRQPGAHLPRPSVAESPVEGCVTCYYMPQREDHVKS